MDLKKGDTVILKSGGPVMRVEKVFKDDGRVRCSWYNIYGKKQYHPFSQTKGIFYPYTLFKIGRLERVHKVKNSQLYCSL